MNVSELQKWAIEHEGKTNQELLALGVLEKRLHKIKPFLKSVKNNCGLVIDNTKRNDICMRNIENDVKLLSDYGLIIRDKKPEGSKYNERDSKAFAQLPEESQPASA